MQEFLEVGRVKEIWRYPVKSMAGESLPEAEIFWDGVIGDRRAAFVRADNDSSFPWLTARQTPQLNQYRPRYTDLADVRHSDVLVQTPGGMERPLGSAELLAEMAEQYGGPVSLLRVRRGIYDALPLSVMSVATAQALAEAVDIVPDVRRWRQNIIIETFDGRPFAEEEWLGQSLQLGAAQIRLSLRIPRCVMVNVDPETAVKNAAVLKLVANTRDNCVGVACATEVIGTVCVGDVVRMGAMSYQL